jgi:hypothetical protein
MLNATAEVNMERAGGIPSRAWIEARRGEGRVPDLGGVCVFVVGADVETSRGLRAREFWLAYLGAAGGRVPSGGYRGLVSRREEIRC